MRSAAAFVAYRLLALLFLACAAAVARAQTEAPAVAPASSRPAEKTTIDEIADCLASGREYLMSVGCWTREKAEGELNQKNPRYSEQVPFQYSEETVCKEPHDPKRILSGDAIRKLADKTRNVAPSGIRIIGAIFCEDLDLAGLDLPYSLVLDRAFFSGNINARNLRIKGDLSFEKSIIIGAFRLNRSRIDGSFYADNSFFSRLTASDVEIKGTWHLNDAVVLKDLHLIGASISGDFYLGGTAVSSVLLQSGHIGGLLDISESEARCSYVMRAITIGRMTADHVGFGTIARSPGIATQSRRYLWWSRLLPAAPGLASGEKTARQIFASRGVEKRLEAFAQDLAKGTQASECEGDKGINELTFALLNSTVQGRVCLTTVAWLPPEYPLDHTYPKTVIALNATRVSGEVAIDLRGNTRTADVPLDDQNHAVLKKKRRFEAIGLSTGMLVFNFAEYRQMPYEPWIDGLNFERIAKARQTCKVAVSDVPDTIPTSKDVIDWVDNNTAPSSQPFKAFVDAFERAGVDATDLRIKRKTRDLIRHTCQLLGIASCADSAAEETRKAIAADAKTAEKIHGPEPAAGSVFGSIQATVALVADVASVIFQWLLFVLASHGLRPAQVTGPLILVLFAYWAVFWGALNIVGFDPKRGDDKSKTAKPNAKGKKAIPPPTPWPIGPLFLFDRLIPIYHIREEDYAIKQYYRRVRHAAAHPASAGPIYPMKFFRWTVMVSPVGLEENKRAEKWLMWLRIIGAVLTIFLLAAINALTRG